MDDYSVKTYVGFKACRAGLTEASETAVQPSKGAQPGLDDLAAKYGMDNLLDALIRIDAGSPVHAEFHHILKTIDRDEGFDFNPDHDGGGLF